MNYLIHGYVALIALTFISFMVGFVRSQAVRKRLARTAGVKFIGFPIFEWVALVVVMGGIALVWPLFMVVIVHGAGVTVSVSGGVSRGKFNAS